MDPPPKDSTFSWGSSFWWVLASLDAPNSLEAAHMVMASLANLIAHESKPGNYINRPESADSWGGDTNEPTNILNGTLRTALSPVLSYEEGELILFQHTPRPPAPPFQQTVQPSS